MKKNPQAKYQPVTLWLTLSILSVTCADAMQPQSAGSDPLAVQLLAQADTLLSFDFAEGVLIYDYPRAMNASERALKLARKFDVDPITMNIEPALTFGLICNELITNSIKYAFTEDQLKKEISLCLKATDESLQINVADNGRTKKNGASTSSRAFGLRFVDQLIRGRLLGEWEYFPGDGFKAHIVVPIPQPKKSQ